MFNHAASFSRTERVHPGILLSILYHDFICVGIRRGEGGLSRKESRIMLQSNEFLSRLLRIVIVIQANPDTGKHHRHVMIIIIELFPCSVARFSAGEKRGKTWLLQSRSYLSPCHVQNFYRENHSARTQRAGRETSSAIHFLRRLCVFIRPQLDHCHLVLDVIAESSWRCPGQTFPAKLADPQFAPIHRSNFTRNEKIVSVIYRFI